MTCFLSVTADAWRSACFAWCEMSVHAGMQVRTCTHVRIHIHTYMYGDTCERRERLLTAGCAKNAKLENSTAWKHV